MTTLCQVLYLGIGDTELYKIKKLLILMELLFYWNRLTMSDIIAGYDKFYEENENISSVQFSSVAQSRPTLHNPMNCSTPGLAVHHQLPEFTQTHIHQVSDAIQPSHPLLSPFPPASNPSQHQSLFQ